MCGVTNTMYTLTLFRLTTLLFWLFWLVSHLRPMGLNVLGYQFHILPVITKNLPISTRSSPYEFLSRCKFSTTLTTRRPMVEFHFLTINSSHVFRYGRQNTNSDFYKNRTHDFRARRLIGVRGSLLDHSGDEGSVQRSNCNCSCDTVRRERVNCAKLHDVVDIFLQNLRTSEHTTRGQLPGDFALSGSSKHILCTQILIVCASPPVRTWEDLIRFSCVEARAICWSAVVLELHSMAVVFFFFQYRSSSQPIPWFFRLCK